MHTPDCLDGNEYWPLDYAEIDISALPAKTTDPNTWTPLKLTGDGPWLGISGNFFGLRISNTTRRNATTGNGVSYPVGKNFVAPWPTSKRGVIDLLLCAETPGATGLALFGRFKTEASARAWCASMDQTGVYNDRTGFYNPPRQGDSFVNQMSSVNATDFTGGAGTKVSITTAQDGFITAALLANFTIAFVGAGEVQLRLTRSSNVMILNRIPNAVITSAIANLPALNLGAPLNNVAGATWANVQSSNLLPFPILSGDTIDIRSTGFATSGTCDVHLGIKRQRSAF